MNENKRPAVGVAVAICQRNLALLGKRLCERCYGHFGFPGGHLEYNESFEHAVLREVREECGPDLSISLPKHWATINVPGDQHYVTILMVSHYLSGLLHNAEPSKSAPWTWYPWLDLPEPLMPGIRIAKALNLNPFAAL